MTEQPSEGHTPGDWRVIIGMTLDLHKRLVASCDCELGVYARQDIRETEQRPNARLISAAPDLLAACEAVQRIAHCLPNTLADVKPLLDAAVAKARPVVAPSEPAG